ncbi:MAG: DUF3883 domain-containing protein [Bacteroidetes bacterium]|nr:DUF3883 domain-containing protein [Bacteroidota bacterium]
MRESINKIQILPMSEDEFEDGKRDLKSIQFDYLLKDLPVIEKGRYYYEKSGISEPKNTMILFKFKTKIIGSGNLLGKDNDERGKYLQFDSSSILVYDKPIDIEEMTYVWPDFKEYGQSKKLLDFNQLDKFVARFSDRLISKDSEEELFQMQEEMCSSNEMDSEIIDKPIPKTKKNSFSSKYFGRDPSVSKRALIKSKELKHSIEKFDIQKQLDSRHFVDFGLLQQAFVQDFTINRIKELTLDDYIEGKGSHTSFCYRIERQLDKIGNMRGSTAEVFVVYYGKKGEGSESKYRFTKKLGQVANEYEALSNVKSEIIKLIKAGRTKDENAIHSNRLADLFKYKVLGTYYPSEYLNLYSHRHIDFFISELGLNPNGKRILDKQKVLLLFKESDELMVKWTNFEFNSFLYTTFGRPPSNDEQEQSQGALPAIEKVKPEIIDLSIDEISKDNGIKGKGEAKPNYKEKADRNNRLGKRGENIVFNIEKEFFKQMGFPIEKLIHSSRNDDRLGYDIQSLDIDGKIKYIEVKATQRQKGNANFIITENEKEKSENLDNYFIYVVFEANTTRPKIWRIEEPFKKYKSKLKLQPINYRVEINVK